MMLTQGNAEGVEAEHLAIPEVPRAAFIPLPKTEALSA
jgi:hypothetical protein